MATVLKPAAANDAQPRDAHEIVRKLVSREFIFGVVGPVGSGTSEVAETLENFLSNASYDVVILKARDIITSWADISGIVVPDAPKMEQTEALQDAGDAYRLKQGSSAVAVGLIEKIRQHRAASIGVDVKNGEAVRPDDKKRAYILDPCEIPLRLKF
ncbi:hypothetical protein [Sphingomonas sp. R86521]|uniref:hypothetical protein n=1 Tax=Sphingomonas sp. R86521 TaxID=3093860 RepID=UPI0036D2CFDE